MVSCTTTLHELKLRIFEALGVHPKNQLLYTARGQLEGEEVTLGQVRRRIAMEWGGCADLGRGRRARSWT